MDRKRRYYVHRDGVLVYETFTTYGSSDATDKAEQMSLTQSGTFVVSNDRGRSLASFTDGDFTYLGY
jgi:hypothetical protein